jgi:hypothetical protein
LQADVAQTVQSWVYRVWVFVLLLSAAGIILYRYGLAREAGIIQPFAQLMADLFRWALLGPGSLVVVLAAGTISSERGTMADSVLSRGISRHQYYLGKWHSRLFSVLVTFLVLALSALVVGSFLLHDDPVDPLGAAWALGAAVCLLAVVVSCASAPSSTAPYWASPWCGSCCTGAASCCRCCRKASCRPTASWPGWTTSSGATSTPRDCCA